MAGRKHVWRTNSFLKKHQLSKHFIAITYMEQTERFPDDHPAKISMQGLKNIMNGVRGGSDEVLEQLIIAIKTVAKLNARAVNVKVKHLKSPIDEKIRKRRNRL